MEASGSITIKNVNSDEEQVDLSYKIVDVGTEEEAKALKLELDKFIKKKGGQTTLDEHQTEEQTH